MIAAAQSNKCPTSHVMSVARRASISKTIDQQIELQPILDHLTARLPLDRAYSEDTESRLPEVMGGPSVALARAFKVIDGAVKNPSSEHWRRCFRVFHLLV
jgi:hypothetical protein